MPGLDETRRSRHVMLRGFRMCHPRHQKAGAWNACHNFAANAGEFNTVYNRGWRDGRRGCLTHRSPPALETAWVEPHARNWVQASCQAAAQTTCPGLGFNPTPQTRGSVARGLGPSRIVGESSAATAGGAARLRRASRPLPGSAGSGTRDGCVWCSPLRCGPCGLVRVRQRRLLDVELFWYLRRGEIKSCTVRAVAHAHPHARTHM